MMPQVHHDQDVQEILERTYKRWEANSPREKTIVLKSVVKQALRNLHRINGVDETMCFLWPMMEKMNKQLEEVNKAKGVQHVRQAS